jgi:hypothetical protein
MNRLPVGHFIIIGLLFWGLPAFFVVGPAAILYTVAAVLPVWLLSRRSPAMRISTEPADRIGTTATFILVACALTYLVEDAFFGQRLLESNLFLHGAKAVDLSVEQSNVGVSQGRGIVVLFGIIISLLPFCLIDVAGKARRFERWALWSSAMLLLFYGVVASRGAVIIAVLTIVMGKTSNWRRIAMAGGLAFVFFILASAARGDFGFSHNPLGEAVGAPYVNLLLMRTVNCGSAHWYNYVAEFFKKFVPSFIYPKSIYSFNTETSLCIYPSADNSVTSVSIFTWLGEIFYYTPSILTAICAGILLGSLGRMVNWQLVRNELPCSRISIGFAIIVLLRSRSQDVLSYLIAQAIFLSFWPYLYRLSKYLRHCVKSSPLISHGLSNDPL